MEKRRQLILKEVEEKGEVRVAFLSQKYNCSEVTIRNDIRVLEQEGALKRVHGGAIALEKAHVRKYSAESVYRNTEQKRKIAACAYNFIDDRDTIIIDDASSSFIWHYTLKSIPKNDLRS